MDRAGGVMAACTPLEARPPNAPQQRPAFPGETRAQQSQKDQAERSLQEIVGMVLADALKLPVIARLLPARRAATADSMTALRRE